MWWVLAMLVGVATPPIVVPVEREVA